jgi:hypothetical protein
MIKRSGVIFSVGKQISRHAHITHKGKDYDYFGIIRKDTLDESNIDDFDEWVHLDGMDID